MIPLIVLEEDILNIVVWSHTSLVLLILLMDHATQPARLFVVFGEQSQLSSVFFVPDFELSGHFIFGAFFLAEQI